MLDKYESLTAGGDSTKANPLMWTEITSSRQAQQDRYDKHLVGNITPISHEEETAQFAEQDEDMQGAWEEFAEYRDEREAEREEAEETEKMEW
jgi:hypothetical protein